MKYRVKKERVLTLTTTGTISAQSEAHAQELSSINDLDNEQVAITDQKTVRASGHFTIVFTDENGEDETEIWACNAQEALDSFVEGNANHYSLSDATIIVDAIKNANGVVLYENLNIDCEWGSVCLSTFLPVGFYDLEVQSVFIGAGRVRIKATSYEEAVFKLTQTREGSDAITKSATWSWLEIEEDRDVVVDDIELGGDSLTIAKVAKLLADEGAIS